MILTKEQMLRMYTGFNEERNEQIVNLPDFAQRSEERGCRSFHTDTDMPLWKIEKYAHRNGFFFWHHFEDDELGGEKSVYTIEEIKPAGTFDTSAAEVRFNEIQKMPEPGSIIDEQRELEHEARRNGLTFEWDNTTQRYACTPLPGRN